MSKGAADIILFCIFPVNWSYQIVTYHAMPYVVELAFGVWLLCEESVAVL